MRFLNRVLRYLRLPQNAGPDDPQTIIGPLIDAQIQAYYAPDNVISNILMQQQPGIVNYIAQVVPEGGSTFMAFGSVGFTLADVPFVRESTRVTISQSSNGTAPFNVGRPDETANLRSPLIVNGGGLFLNGCLFLGETVTFNGDAVLVDSPSQFTEDIAITADMTFVGGSLAIGTSTGFTIDGKSAPRGLLGANTYTGGGFIAASTGTTEVAITSATWGSEPTYDFPAGRLFRYTCMGLTRLSAATDSGQNIKVRKGAQTTTGTVLGSFSVNMSSFGSTGAPGWSAPRYFKNGTGSLIQSKLSLTNARIGGAATIDLYGDTTQPIAIVVEDVGIASEHPTIQALSL